MQGQQQTIGRPSARPLCVTLALCGLLAACGGGGGGGGDLSGGGVTPAEAPRIEPYERTTALAGVKSAVRPAGVTATPVALGTLPAGAIEAAARKPVAVSGTAASIPGETPRRIGLARASAQTATVAATSRALIWQPTEGGGRAAALRFGSDAAAALRIGLLVQQLPATALVRAWGSDGEVTQSTGAEIAAALERNAQAGERGAAARTWWLPSVVGAQATVEIALPPGVDPAGVQVSVPTVSHLWVNLAGKDAEVQLKIGESGSCNVDATCTDQGTAEGRAVARMEFISGGDAFLCTGTLLADTTASGTPWFLAASHCISSQVAASTLSTYWFYRSASCNSGTLTPGAIRTNGGATLLYTSGASDTSFMRLLTPPPAGTLHAGSLLAVPTAGITVSTLHHPSGDVLKVSQGTLSAYAICSTSSATANCSLVSSSSGANFLAARWASGTTESGSSGAPLLTQVGSRRYVLGHLFAGLASCAKPGEPDYYGRFDVAYRDGLYQWLGQVPAALK